MAEFLTTNGVSFQIEQIIIGAKSKLVLVSPYLKLSKIFHERLKDADARNVKISIIYGKNELNPNETNQLAELKNIELYFFENLHAKCYFNETKMVITSMNMYEFSQINNREMGVLIDSLADSELFEKAKTEARSIVTHSKHIQINKPNQQIQIKNTSPEVVGPKQTTKKKSKGFCIRCESRIDFNIEKPYCPDCFEIWYIYEYPDYIEDVCHHCGEEEDTSMNKPLCKKCYNIWKNPNRH